MLEEKRDLEMAEEERREQNRQEMLKEIDELLDSLKVSYLLSVI